MTKKIIGMGNAVLDILTKVENNFIDENNLSKGTMAIVSKDESQKILEKIEMIKTDSGGSVANTISTISLLGLESSFCGKVMNDKLGNDFENKMTESGTNFLCDKSNSGLPTARCVVFVTPDGERTMQTFLGASTTLSAADIREEYFKEQDFLLIEGYLWSSETAREAITKAVNFCKQFNDRTKDNEKGLALPVIINVYKDRSFDFVIKSTPASILLKKAAGIQKGSPTPQSNKVGKVTKKQLEDIVKQKEGDLNAADLDQAVKIIAGTARSMGIEVE